MEDDITAAVSRRIECTWGSLAPLVLPVLLSPSRWKEASRLAKFEPLAKGVPLSNFSQLDDGYLMVTEQIAALVKVVQARLNEAKFYQYHPASPENGVQPIAKNSVPYLGEDPAQFEFQSPAQFRPPEWAGWSLIALIFMLSAGSFRQQHPAVSSLHLKARPDKVYETEYPRTMPMMPRPDDEAIVLPPAEH